MRQASEEETPLPFHAGVLAGIRPGCWSGHVCSYCVCGATRRVPVKSHVTSAPNAKPPTWAKKATPPPFAEALNSPKFASMSLYKKHSPGKNQGGIGTKKTGEVEVKAPEPG